jgi:hypothetical protein
MVAVNRVCEAFELVKEAEIERFGENSYFYRKMNGLSPADSDDDPDLGNDGVHAHEGFCEDLARQNTVAHLSQLQLGFRRCRIWVSVLSHIGFSHRRGVLKTTI